MRLVPDRTLSFIFTKWIRAPEHPMKIRLLRYLANATGNRLVPVPYASKTRLRVQPMDYIGFKVIQSGAYEPRIYELLLSILDKSSTYVDIGSHIGCFAIPLATRCRAVFAIDANPSMVGILAETASMNQLSNLKCFNLAISDADGMAEFFVARSGNTGTSSLLATWPHGMDVERITIPCMTLATWLETQGIDRIDCVKVDAEGATGRIISGAASVLKRIGTIVAEDSPDIVTALEILREHGFTVSYPFKDLADTETRGTVFAVNPMFLSCC